MATRQQLLSLIDRAPRTPLALVWELERGEHHARDVRSVLLELMTDGSVEFGVDGMVRRTAPAKSARKPSKQTQVTT